MNRAASRLIPLLAVALPACQAPPERGDHAPAGGAGTEVVSAEAGPSRLKLPEPDPNGVTYYRWDDVYSAGRLDWAWAIAVDHGNLEQVERLLADGVDPDVPIGGDYQASAEPRRHGRTALMAAAWLGYEELARRLLEAGADPLARELREEERFSGDTALHKAASQGHAGIVRMLLDAGVPANLEGQNGYMPLFYAHDEPECFRLLREHGADLDRAGGATLLLDSAASSRSTEMAALLLELGADIEGVDGKRRYGYTPLWSAAVGGYGEMVLFLLEHGADPHVEPAGGDLPDLAREAGHEEIAAMIERARAGEALRPAEDPGAG